MGLVVKFVEAFTAASHREASATRTVVARTTSVEVASTTTLPIATHAVEAHADAQEEVLTEDGGLTIDDAGGRNGTGDRALLAQDVEHLDEGREVLLLEEGARQLGVPDALVAGHAGAETTTSDVVEVG